MSGSENFDHALASWIGGGSVTSDEAGQVMAYFLSRYQSDGSSSDAIRLASAFMFLGGALHAEGRDSWRKPLTIACDMWHALEEAFWGEFDVEEIGNCVVLLPFSATFYAGMLEKQLGSDSEFEAARNRMRKLLSEERAPELNEMLHGVLARVEN